jgi:hypothetical protein
MDTSVIGRLVQCSRMRCDSAALVSLLVEPVITARLRLPIERGHLMHGATARCVLACQVDKETGVRQSRSPRIGRRLRHVQRTSYVRCLAATGARGDATTPTADIAAAAAASAAANGSGRREAGEGSKIIRVSQGSRRKYCRMSPKTEARIARQKNAATGAPLGERRR